MWIMTLNDNVDNDLYIMGAVCVCVCLLRFFLFFEKKFKFFSNIFFNFFFQFLYMGVAVVWGARGQAPNFQFVFFVFFSIFFFISRG